MYTACFNFTHTCSRLQSGLRLPGLCFFDDIVGEAAAQLGKRTGQVGDAQDVSRGGLSIVIDDVCCGGIGVSGVKPASLELIADAGIKELRKMSFGTTELPDDVNEHVLDV